MAAAESEDEYDWTICSHSRVVGCAAAPTGATFDEFRCLNADELDDRYSSPQGIYRPGCGMENVLLTWTGPEYMYHFMTHNNVSIPSEGFAVLRLFPLFDWHTLGGYEILANEDDVDVHPFVLDFDEMRRSAMRSTEMSEEECDVLWFTHYSHLVSKYGADGLLMW
jgi:inositol oxygenase